MRAPDDIALIAFDIDGTLVESPHGHVIWELLNHRFTGGPEIGAARFRSFLAGEIDYAQWVALDVQGWIDASATRSEIVEEVRKLRPIDDAHDTLLALRARGYRLAVISGTLDVVIEEHFPEHPFEAVFTNKLHFDAEDRLIGWTATPYDQEGKAHALEMLAEQNGLPLSRCAFVGDHMNDCAVARRAGFSIAWNPKVPELEQAATCTVRGTSLRAILDRFQVGA
ncbi:MAG: HAD family phosphatase [Candidatus Eisenbacteria bacterium]|nr:HAD family phosphatase [Candidatus Eisenbacteria bacterium]MCC7142496.1 HAD family phosphatase [Candidatus Eisenbacteria bacterium]